MNPAATRVAAVLIVGVFSCGSVWVAKRAQTSARRRAWLRAVPWLFAAFMAAVLWAMGRLEALAQTSRADAALYWGLVAVLLGTLAYMFIFVFARKKDPH